MRGLTARPIDVEQVETGLRFVLGGLLMKTLSRHCGEIHGVDVADEMIRLGRERFSDIPHAHFHLTDGGTHPQFADESFEFLEAS